MDYPKTNEAFKEIAYDNGMIFRDNPEEVVLAGMWAEVTKKYTPTELNVCEQFLHALSPEDFQEVLTNESEGAVKAPELVNNILNCAFEAPLEN